MTAITLHWKGPAGSASIDITASGFYAGHGVHPDIFAEVGPERSCFILANGEMDTVNRKPAVANAPMVGQYAVTVAGTTLVKWMPASIIFGCGEVIRLGAPTTYQASREWRTFWTRDMPTDEKDIVLVLHRLEAMSHAFDDVGFANPDQSGSARVCQSAWSGTLAAALAVDQDEVRVAAETFCDFQLRWRHALFYGSDGALLKAHEQSWWRVGPTGFDGQVKLVIACPYKFETTQHLAPDRFIELAVDFNDFAALVYTNAYIEAVLTRPEFRSGQIADDQRSHGYCIRLAALWTLAGLATQERDKALLRVVDGWRWANGKAFTGEPYPSIAPNHTGKWSHNWPSLVDWLPYSKAHNLLLPPELLPPLPGETCDHLRPWLKAEAIKRGLPATTFTDGQAGLWQGAVVVWQVGPALGALCAIRDVPAAADLVPDIHKLIQHSAACIVGPGMAPDGVGPSGLVMQPNPTWDCYVARFPKRVMMGPGKNGTTVWLVNPLLSALDSCGPALKAQAYDAAKLIHDLTDYPSPADLQVVGLRAIKEFGHK